MRGMVGFLGLLLTLGIVYFLYNRQLTGDARDVSQPAAQMQVTGVRTDLLGLAQAERIYLATHGTYATLSDLEQAGSYSGKHRSGYTYRVEIDGARHFEITAAPVNEHSEGLPTFTIDETMQVRRK